MYHFWSLSSILFSVLAFTKAVVKKTPTDVVGAWLGHFTATFSSLSCIFACLAHLDCKLFSAENLSHHVLAQHLLQSHLEHLRHAVILMIIDNLAVLFIGLIHGFTQILTSS